jgi:choline kinase
VTAHGLDLVILAAGRGSRLATLGDDRPKWLLEVNGGTIAERQLAALSLLPPGGLRSLTVVTGHAAAALADVDLGPVGTALHNPSYLTRNNWFSVLLAMRALGPDARMVVLNGDLCASPEWIAQFLIACLDAPHDALLAVDFDRELTAESMKVSAGIDGRLATIGKHEFADPVGEYVGMLFACGESGRALRAALERFDADPAAANEWYEGAVGLTAAAGTRWALWPTPDSGWVEIDDLEDLRRAESLAASRA